MLQSEYSLNWILLQVTHLNNLNLFIQATHLSKGCCHARTTDLRWSTIKPK